MDARASRFALSTNESGSIPSNASSTGVPNSAPLPFPIFRKDAQFDAGAVPSTYYLITGDGLFLLRRTELYSASVPVDQVAGLQPHRPELTLHIPRLPRRLMERALGFFRAVWDKWQGEAIVIMFYAPSTRRFAFRAPPQRITGRFIYGKFYADMRLDYGSCERPGPEFVKLGTFHSHGNGGAGHSSIDVHDELYESGLHLTAGYVNTSLPEITAAFVVSGTRFTVRLSDILPVMLQVRSAPRQWLERVTVIEERPPVFRSTGGGSR
jgi:hypothetical protein